MAIEIVVLDPFGKLDISELYSGEVPRFYYTGKIPLEWHKKRGITNNKIAIKQPINGVILNIISGYDNIFPNPPCYTILITNISCDIDIEYIYITNGGDIIKWIKANYKTLVNYHLMMNILDGYIVKNYLNASIKFDLLLGCDTTILLAYIEEFTASERFISNILAKLFNIHCRIMTLKRLGDCEDAIAKVEQQYKQYLDLYIEELYHYNCDLNI